MVRPTIPLLLSLAFGGCFTQLDEQRLTVGVNDAGQLICHDFTSVDAGMPAEGWNVHNGDWEVALRDGAPAYVQARAPLNGALYKSTFGMNAWRRVTIEASIKVAGGVDLAECVIARFLDKDHFYRLCLEGGKQWRLARVEGAAVMGLKSGMMAYTAGSKHTLKLEAKGTQLTATVDALAPVVTYDRLYQQGTVGVASQTTSEFSRYCVYVQ